MTAAVGSRDVAVGADVGIDVGAGVSAGVGGVLHAASANRQIARASVRGADRCMAVWGISIRIGMTLYIRGEKYIG